MEAAIPITPKKIDIQEDENETYEIIEEKKFSVEHNNETYLLSISKTNKDSILFKLKLNKEFITEYYQKNYKIDSLIKISDLFKFYNTLEESYSFILEILEKNTKEVKMEFSKYNVKIKLDVFLLLNKKVSTIFVLKKKEISICSNLNLLNGKIINFQGNQTQLEDKLEKINELLNQKKEIEDELKVKINELANVKNSQIDLENSIKENKNSIKDISNEQKNILDKIEEISSNNNNKLEIISKKYDEINSNSTKNHEMYLEMKENLKSFQKSLANINEEINLVKNKQEQIKTNIEKKKKETDLMIKKQANLEESNKNDINELKKEIEFLKNDMEKKIEDLTKKIEKMGEKKEEKENRLKIEKKKKEEKEYIKLKNCLNNPKYFKYDELISKDLFTKNYYNNRACIFNSNKFNKIYIAFGDKNSLNLECYDVLDSKKFTIIKKLHEKSFNSCRYYFNKNEKLDLLITASLDNRVKIINFKKEKSEILINLSFKSEEKIIINTAFFVDDLIMVPFSNRVNGSVYFYEPHYKSVTKYKYIDKIDSNAGFILGLNSCYCKFNYYVLIANSDGIISYTKSKSSSPKLHHKFIPPFTEKEKENNGFDEPYIIEKDGKYILIGPCFYHPYLFFWDFFDGDLIYKMEFESGISDICLWDDDYLFASFIHGDYQFALINVNDKKVEKTFSHKEGEQRGCGVKIVKNKFYGNYLISTGLNGYLDLYSMNDDDFKKN